MIVSLLMDAIRSVILFLIGLFPALPDMSSLTEYFDPVFQLYGNVDSFISVKLLGVCVVFIFLFSNAEMIWGVIMWVVRKIPGVS